MRMITYNREAAVSYARRWAFGRNPKYYNFDKLGGDCTNFASQCLFAGCGVMNYTQDVGWYYRSLNQRAAAWTGVEFFYQFLTTNSGIDGIDRGQVVGDGAGPFAKIVPMEELEIGDFVQFGKDLGEFYHTCVVVGFAERIPLLAAHTYDALNRPITSYQFSSLRCLHILGARG